MSDREVCEHFRRIADPCDDCGTARNGVDALELKNKLLLKAEHRLSDAYLRIREKLGAWETPHAPTSDQVYEHTEAKLDALLRKVNVYEMALKALATGCCEMKGCSVLAKTILKEFEPK